MTHDKQTEQDGNRQAEVKFVNHDDLIQYIIEVVENTHLGNRETDLMARRLPYQDSEKYFDDEPLAIEIWERSHGKENLERIKSETHSTNGKKCSECGDRLLYP